MSSILKALQKLEQERAARRGGPPDITGAIARQTKVAKPSPSWLLPVGVTIGAVVAVVVTYSIMGGFSHEKDAAPAAKSPPTSPSSRDASLSSPPATSVPSAVLPPAHLPAVSPAKGTPVLARPVPQLAPPSPAPALPKTPAPSVSPAPSTPSVPTNTAALPGRQVTPAPAPSRGDMPVIAVSGIAWQKDSSDRLAVINGSPVSEGATVEGARVEEIFPDKVRFSYRNEHFDVQLGKSSR